MLLGEKDLNVEVMLIHFQCSSKARKPRAKGK